MESEPKTLYKYRSLSDDSFEFTHDIFVKDELYFPHPNQINDPFDCKIPPYLNNLTKEQVIKKLETCDPKQFLKTGKNLETIKENVMKASMLQIREKLIQDLKSHEDVGVLSFSEKYSDILMWSHYANSHHGICIGFDYSQLSFSFRGGPVPPEQVKYPEDNKYPKWNPFEIVEVTHDNANDMAARLYFTKAKDWKYEKEWRVVIPQKGGEPQKFQANALVSVYLGYQITKDHKDAVINWCLQRKRKPKIYQTSKSEISYSLNKDEIHY